MSESTIVFVTGNAGKLSEVQTMLSSGEATIAITSRDIDLPELQGTPEEISREKCRLAVKEIRGPCMVEDTCLCFNALNGMPGPYIKWFLQAVGHEGINKMLSGFDDKSAYALCVFSYTTGVDQEVHTFVGRTEGKIVSARGTSNFGWDPIFEPTEGGGRTFAEMTKDEKNLISHRKRSVDKLREFLLAHPLEEK